MATENYLLSVQGTTQASYNQCVMCFQSAGLSSTDTLDAGRDLISAFIGHAQALWLQCLPNSYQVTALTARRAFPHPSATAVKQFQFGTQTGSAGANSTSLSLCPSIFLVPPMGTKSGGRVFMPCVSDGDYLNNAPAAGYLANIGLVFGAMITGLAGSGTNWKLAIYSRRNGSAALALTFGISSRIGFQGRRRKPVGGV